MSERVCGWLLPHRDKHNCGCQCKKPYGHKGYHRCELDLAASHECARRIRQGEAIVDVARYVRVRGEKMVREHARLWASLPSPDPIDFARAIETQLGDSAEPAAPKIRVINGTEHRHILGTGWCPPLPIEAYQEVDA